MWKAVLLGMSVVLFGLGRASAALPVVEATRPDVYGFTLGWAALPQDIDEARVEMLGPKGGKNFSVLATVSKTTRGYLVQRLSYPGKYKFRLSVVRGGVVENGPVASYTTLKNKVRSDSAAGLIEMTAFATQVELKWTDSAAKETGMKIFRRDEFHETQPVEILLPKDTIYHRDAVPVPGKRYYYSVAAGDKQGLGWPSMEIEVNVPLPGDPPVVVSSPNLTVTREGSDTVLRWNPVFGGNTEGYSVQREFSQGWSYWIEVGRTGRFDNAFVDHSPGASASRSYRLIGFNANSLADPYRGTRDFPPFPSTDYRWQPPVLAGGLVYLLDADGTMIHRFDTAARTWLPPVVPRLQGPVQRIAASEDHLFVQSREELYRVSPDTGAVTLLGSGFGFAPMVVEGNFLIYQGQSYVVIEVGPDGRAVGATRPYESQFSGSRLIGTAPGRHLFFGNAYSINGPAVQAAEFDPETGAMQVFTSRVPATASRLFPVSGGKMLLSDKGWITVEGDTSSDPIANVTVAGVLDAASLPAQASAVLHEGEIRIFDRWWNETRKIVVPADVIALRWSNGRLWAIAEDDSLGSGWRVDGHEVEVVVDDAAFWTSPILPEGLESTADGGQILLHRASGTWRRREPGAAAFGPAQEGSEGIIDWKFDRAGDGLAILWGGGKVTRKAFSGSSAGTWEASVRRDAAFMVEIGGKLEFANNQALAADGQPVFSQGYWIHRPKFTEWDGTKKYLYFQWFYELLTSSRTGNPYENTPSLRELNEESFHSFLRISPERDLALFGGGLMCTYPGFVSTRQLPLDAKDGEWTSDGLFAAGKDAAGRPMLGSFDRGGKMRAAALLPGEATQLAREGADGWMVLCRLPAGGWQLIRTQPALTSFEKLAGGEAPLPVGGATLPDATLRFPDWYEDQVAIGDPDGNGLTAVQEYMMARYPEYKTLPAVAIDRSRAIPRFQIRRRPDEALAPFRVAIEHSADLKTWSESIPDGFNVILQNFGGFEIIWIEPKAGTNGGFFRVRFVGPTFGP
jgi:hypothetical protein